MATAFTYTAHGEAVLEQDHNSGTYNRHYKRSTTVNSPTAHTPFVFYKGVDNHVTIVINDKSRRPSNIRDKTIKCKLVNRRGDFVTLITKNAIVESYEESRVRFEFTPGDIANLDPAFYELAITAVDNNGFEFLYRNQLNYKGEFTIEVRKGPLGATPAAQTVSTFSGEGAQYSRIAITDIQLLSPIRITLGADHIFIDGQSITITGVTGTTELNGNAYFVRTVPGTRDLDLYSADPGSAATGKKVAGVTNGATAQMTSPNHGFSNGQKISITNVDGMNDPGNPHPLNGKSFYVGDATTNTFNLYIDINLSIALNTSAFSVYIGGGDITINMIDGTSGFSNYNSGGFATRSQSTNPFYSGSVAGATQKGHRDGLHTVAIYTTAFKGKFYIEGSVEINPTDADYWQIETNSIYGYEPYHTATTGVRAVNFQHNIWNLRFYFIADSDNTGTVDKVVVRT